MLYSLLTFYLIFLSYFDPLKLELLGNGIIYKFSILIFDNFVFSKIFIYKFFVSLTIIYLFIDDVRDYFYSIIDTDLYFDNSLYQEYYDPIILILVLMFFYTKLSFSFLKILFLYSYFFIFIIANVHYKSQLFYFLNESFKIPKNIFRRVFYQI